MAVKYFNWVPVILILLTGCSGNSSQTPIPTLSLPTAPVTQNAVGGVVTASGEVVPFDSYDLGFSIAGMIKDVKVKEGDAIQPGQVIASLDNINQLEALVKAKEGILFTATKTQKDLVVNAPLELANSYLAFVKAQKQYDDALKTRKKRDFSRCNKDTIDLYFRILGEAEQYLEKLKEKNDASTTHLENITHAQDSVNIARANYEYCLKYTPFEISESEADLAVADANLKHTKSRYDLLSNSDGIDPDEAAILQAAVENAQAELDIAKMNLEYATLKSPVKGQVVSLNIKPGQPVIPGLIVITISDLGKLQVETTDLSEKDIPKVAIGQPAIIFVEALGLEIPGEVTKIAPNATKVGGDVVYKVTIMLNEQPETLRWGMSTKVEISP